MNVDKFQNNLHPILQIHSTVNNDSFKQIYNTLALLKIMNTTIIAFSFCFSSLF